MLYPGCYTAVDCDSENTGFLTRANAARFQGQPAQVIGPLRLRLHGNGWIFDQFEIHFFNLIFYY